MNVYCVSNSSHCLLAVRCSCEALRAHLEMRPTTTSLLLIIKGKIYVKCKVLSIDYPKRMQTRAHTHARTHARTHTRTHARTHSPAFWLYKAKFTQLKTGSKPRQDGWRQQHGTENIAGLHSCFFSCFWTSPERVSVGEEGQGHSNIRHRSSCSVSVHVCSREAQV